MSEFGLFFSPPSIILLFNFVFARDLKQPSVEIVKFTDTKLVSEHQFTMGPCWPDGCGGRGGEQLSQTYSLTAQKNG